MYTIYDINNFIQNNVNNKEESVKNLLTLFPRNDPNLKCNTCGNKKPSNGWEVIYTDGECYCSTQCYTYVYKY